MSSALTPIEVFCSYAHEDEPHLHQLKAHLSGLEHQGLISIWHDHLIPVGTDTAQAIDTHLETASLILLLVSANFLASDWAGTRHSTYGYGDRASTRYNLHNSWTQIQRAVERHETNQARVIPIILRPCDWRSMPFAHLQCLPHNGRPITTWENQDLAWHNVAAGVRRAIEDLLLLAASTPHAELPAIWNIPYPRNPFFIGRDDLLSHLYTQLQGEQITVISQPQAISGLGGIGKTQVAVEYAYRYYQEYEVVLWARAENQETLISSYNTIATLLKLPEREVSEQEITIRAVKKWLQTHRKWLLILDNADNLNLLPAFLPPVPRGHILLTTRVWDMQRLAQRIEVETLPLEQGTVFLLRRASLIAPDAMLEQARLEDRQAAMQIAQELGGLPLALDQAGAYLEATGMSLSQYRQIYQRHRHVLLRERRAMVPDHPEPVTTTWSLSFQQVEQHNAAAAELLRLCAYLAPDAIPEKIITQGAPHLGPRLKPVAADPLRLGQAIEALRAYSLIQRDPRTQTLSVHRLVQAVLRDSTATKSQKQWKKRVVRAVDASCPNVRDVPQWDACELWLPHAQVCATWIEQEDITLTEAAHLLNEAGCYLDDRGRYREAEPLYLRALQIRERLLGAEHPDTANSLNNLALLYHHQGEFAQAEPLYLRALQIREQFLGADHPDTAESLNNLAGLYQNQSKFAEAESLLLRALNIDINAYGEDHPEIATDLNNLACLYRSQGKFAEAESLYLRALATKERQLGAEHPSTATSLNNLASLYRSQGKFAEAEPLYLRALQIRERLLGAEHLDTANSLNNLALLYHHQGEFAQAEPLYVRTLAILKQQLGPQHPRTKKTQENYVSLLRAMGRDQEAESLETNQTPSL